MSRQKKIFYVKLNTDQGSHDKKNMTVNELAKRLGMNRRYVNQVVTGSKPGSYHLYVRIAEALGVPLAALFDDYPLSRLDGWQCKREGGDERSRGQA